MYVTCQTWQHAKHVGPDVYTVDTNLWRGRGPTCALLVLVKLILTPCDYTNVFVNWWCDVSSHWCLFSAPAPRISPDGLPAEHQWRGPPPPAGSAAPDPPVYPGGKLMALLVFCCFFVAISTPCDRTFFCLLLGIKHDPSTFNVLSSASLISCQLVCVLYRWKVEAADLFQSWFMKLRYCKLRSCGDWTFGRSLLFVHFCLDVHFSSRHYKVSFFFSWWRWSDVRTIRQEIDELWWSSFVLSNG